MKSNIEDISLLDAYIHGQLSGLELEALESRLQSEPDLMDDLTTLQKVTRDARISSLNDTWGQIKSFEDEFISKKAETRHPKKTKKWLYLMISAIILLLIIAVLWNLGQKQKKYPEQYADLFENRFEKELILHVTYRSTNQEINLSKEQKMAYNLYAIKEFENCIPLLENLWKNQNDTLALYYLGISQLGVGDISKSKEILSSPALYKFNTSFIKN